MKRTRALFAFLTIVAAAGQSIVAAAPTAGPGRAAPATSGESFGSPVRDERVTFDGFRLLCGSGRVGDDDSMLDPDGVHCTVGIGVVNVGDEAVRLAPFASVLRTRDGVYRPWRSGMKELFLDDAGNLFGRSIPPGGGGLGALVFELRSPSRPVALELHEADGSSGGLLLLKTCEWSDRGGSCREQPDRGEAGNAFPREVVAETRYPHKLLMDQPTCFDRRAWWGVRGTEGMQFEGQGTIELDRSGLVAYFHDNSGATVLLRQGHENLQDENVCG